MPIFIPAIIGALIQIAGSLVGRVLLALGMGVATYTGLSVTLSFLKSQLLGSIALLPPGVVGILGVLKVGESIGVVTSAIAVRLVLQGLTGDTLKKWVIK